MKHYLPHLGIRATVHALIRRTVHSDVIGGVQEVVSSTFESKLTGPDIFCTPLQGSSMSTVIIQ